MKLSKSVKFTQMAITLYKANGMRLSRLKGTIASEYACNQPRRVFISLLEYWSLFTSYNQGLYSLMNCAMTMRPVTHVSHQVNYDNLTEKEYKLRDHIGLCSSVVPCTMTENTKFCISPPSSANFSLKLQAKLKRLQMYPRLHLRTDLPAEFTTHAPVCREVSLPVTGNYTLT